MSATVRIHTRECPFCGKQGYVDGVKLEDFEQWKRGEVLIQEAFPYLTADERELLLTGIHKECWDDAFDPEVDDVLEDSIDLEGPPALLSDEELEKAIQMAREGIENASSEMDRLRDSDWLVSLEYEKSTRTAKTAAQKCQGILWPSGPCPNEAEFKVWWDKDPDEGDDPEDWAGKYAPAQVVGDQYFEFLCSRCLEGQGEYEEKPAKVEKISKTAGH